MALLSQVLLYTLMTICLTGSVLYAYICLKLIQYGQRSFINIIFMVLFCLNIFLSPLIVYFFFIIGITTFTEGSSARIADSCQYYMQVWTSWNIFNAFGNIGMMFCRFIYVRYATGLVKNGTKLFHILVCCVSGTFTLQWLGIQPLYYWLMVDNPMKTTLKGQICTRTQLTIFEDINKTINFSIKSKLLIITFSVLFLMVSLYFTKSSKRMNSKFKIPKRRINIFNMKMQILLRWHFLYKETHNICPIILSGALIPLYFS